MTEAHQQEGIQCDSDQKQVLGEHQYNHKKGIKLAQFQGANMVRRNHHGYVVKHMNEVKAHFAHCQIYHEAITDGPREEPVLVSFKWRNNNHAWGD